MIVLWRGVDLWVESENEGGRGKLSDCVGGWVRGNEALLTGLRMFCVVLMGAMEGERQEVLRRGIKQN
jgi:hypothetical protein